MARKCNAPGCGFPLPDKYPLEKCPWHMAPGRGPVKIAAALAIAAAGLGGGFAYKKFRTYLSEKKRRKERRERRDASVAQQKQKVSSARKAPASKVSKPRRKRTKASTKAKRAE